MEPIERLAQDLDRVAAPWVKALGLRLVEVADDGVVFDMPVTPQLVHGGGVLCGQAVMAAADTAMVIGLSAVLGEFRPMTTVQLSCSFLKAVPAQTEKVTVRCRVLRKGRTLAFGEVEVAVPDGVLVAHATTTYALL